MKISRNSLFLLLPVLLLVGGFVYYQWAYLPAQAAPAPEFQTARVRTGDIRITAPGAGNLLPAAEAAIGFRSSGVLVELNAAVGDTVQAGQVLARLDETSARLQLAQAQYNLEALTSPFAIAGAEKDLADAIKALEEAEEARQSQQAGERASESTINATQAQLVLAEADVEAAWLAYEPLSTREEDDIYRAAALAKYAAAVQNRDTLAEKLDGYLGAPTVTEQAALDAAEDLAVQRVAAARALLNELHGEPVESSGLAVNPDLNQLRQARIAVQNAEIALKNTVLVAPFDGVVTKISAGIGETVSAGPVVSLASLDQPLVRFYLEEVDLAKVKVGNPVLFTFDAYPDLVLSGEVTRIEPALATVDGTAVVTAWATLNAPEDLVLVSGMAAEVEVVAGESKNTLLVPAQALRELAPGSYAVFLVDAEGALKLTPVTVGLQDFANAEILSGLNAGDTVSTGSVETE